MDKFDKSHEFKDKSDTPIGKSYTVQAGDTLSAIALNFYGDASQYMVIYEANKDLIGDNPDLIKVGQILIIPPKK
jgi:nucleoid-associated protein YgaU